MKRTKRSALGRVGAALSCGAVCIGLLAASGCAKEVAADAETVLSHGVSVFSAFTDVAVSAPVGNDVTFEAEDFARGLNLSSVTSITVRSLPEASAGELLLGATRVAVGQTISAENLAHLTFAAASDDVREASFTFSANQSATAVVCRVYLLAETNYTPTVSMASGVVLNVSTFRDMESHGTLSAYDPDGDTMTFEIVTPPQNGSVRLTDAAKGEYVYAPNENFVGNDRFCYVARDRYGNYSAMATVSLQVTSPGTSVTYVDMQSSQAYVAALALTEAGVMSGTQVGKDIYFYPDRTVSRAEFLVMAMNAAGITEVPSCEETGFYDDDEIPTAMKGYVAAAYAMGYVSGSLQDGNLCFLPNQAIDRADAAVMLDRIVEGPAASVIPTFADSSDIPVWAKDAIYSLNALGIMDATDGCIAPNATLTRGETAKMLNAVMTFYELK